MSTTGKILLNKRFFSPDRLKINRHRLVQVGEVSYPTILRYLNDEPVDTFSGNVLYAILIAGFGYSEQAVADLRLGEVFDIVSNGRSDN